MIDLPIKNNSIFIIYTMEQYKMGWKFDNIENIENENLGISTEDVNYELRYNIYDKKIQAIIL